MKTQLVVKVFVAAVVLLLCCLSGFVQAKVIFVDANRFAGGDGTNWEKAYPYLQYALAAAVSGDYIVVARGTYKPDRGVFITPGDRSASFKLKGGVEILGGYAGYNAPNPDEHNAAKNKTILSGDLNGDDGPNFTNYSDNSYNVVTCDSVTQNAKISWFTITGGNAEGPYPYNRGGGMLITSSTGVGVSECIFSGNMAQHAGGGLYSMNGSNPQLVNCIFSGNKAQNVGGGMQDAGGSSTLINCTFYGNMAVDGPGWGGGLRVYNSTTKMINCILWDNSAANGNQIAVDTGSTLNISYSDVQGGQAAIYKPDASTITWGSGNIDADPLFEEVAQGNYHLRKGSPCVDTGTKTGAPLFDYEESPRLSGVLGDDKPDIGADELIVREVGNTGYSTIQAAIDAAQTGDLVLVLDGTYVENVDFKGKAIRVRSSNGVAKTIIDGNANGNVITFETYEGQTSILDGFTVKKGGFAGISCYSSSPTITNCIISENQGSGISSTWDNPILTNLIITLNNGGVSLFKSSPNLTNCIIAKNNATDGGGVSCTQSSPSFTNCTIAQNTATNSGGGLNVIGPGSHPTVKNSILWGDTAGETISEIFLDQNASISITYSDIQGSWTGQGNINSDPLFEGGSDYHLTADSPCIDTGTSVGAPAYDLNGATRPVGAGYDMGAYEYQAGVQVIKPNGGESWNRNSRRVITWNASGCQGNLKITLWQNGGLIGTIADNINPAVGSYSWIAGNYIGGTAPLGTGYTIKIEDNGSMLEDSSDAPFSIVKISVKAPNGGESWQIGSTQNITWVAKSISGQLRIVLFKNGVKVGNIVNSINPALNTYYWSVGNYVGGTAAAGSGYSIQIREIGTDAGDRSDSTFTLTAP